jgi:osmotically-inducible protein OsmY
VVNKIDVKPQVYSGDIRRAIEEALDRRAEQQAAGVGIEVNDGRVKLTGIVKTWAEKQAILDASRATLGVHSIDDELSIATPA